jgi:hypothetical protein
MPRRVVMGLLLCAATVVAGSGCRRSSGKPPAGKLEGLGKLAVDVLPQDTAIVVGLSTAGLRETAVWQKGAPPFLAAEGEIPDWLRNVKEICGFDPVTAIDAVVLAVTDPIDAERAALLVQGKITEADLDRCVVAFGDKILGAAVVVDKKDGITEYAGNMKSSNRRFRFYVAWIAPDSVLLLPGAPDNRARLEELVARRATARDNKDLMGLIQHVDTTALAWAAMLRADGDEEAIKVVPIEDVRGVYATLRASGDGASGWLGLRFPVDKQAKTASKQATRELESLKKNPAAAPYVERVRLSAAGKDLIARVEIPSSVLNDLGEKLAKTDPAELETLIRRVAQLASAQGGQEEEEE